MTDREKLIELLAEPCRKRTHCSEDYCKRNREHCQSDFADHLIANGVTFAKDTDVPNKWISVEDRLPEDLPENRSKKVINCIVAHPRGGSGRLESQFRQRKWDRHREEWYWSKIGSRTVTHWMPMPEPPRVQGVPNGTDHI